MAITNIPTNAGYGTVVGQFILAYGDSSDSDPEPNAIPASGSVVFTPSTGRIKDATASPNAVTILPAAVECQLDADGYILGYSGHQGVNLIATNDADLNPLNWTWRVDFRLTDPAGDPVRIDGFSFALPQGTTVDLTVASPVPNSNGVYYNQGPKGDTGATGATGPAGDPGMVWQGDWDSGTTYADKDAVAYGGSSWVSVVGSNTSEPGSDSNWDMLAQQGNEGTQGITGDRGGVPYRFSTTSTDGDPGTGYFRYNSTVAGATEIYISTSAEGGASVADWLASFDDSTSTNKGVLRILSRGTTVTVVDIFNVTSITSATGYYKLGVTYVSGIQPSNSQPLVLDFMPTGDLGAKGDDGAGVQAGGTTNQLLAKASNTDYDTQWVDAPNAANGIPTGGAQYTMLVKTSATDYATTWTNTIEGGTA